MAISGDLSDISVVDVFRVLRAKTGLLHIDSTPGAHDLTIGLHTNHAVSLLVGDRSVTTREDAAETVRELLTRATGRFRFDATDAAPRSFILPLYPIVQASTQAHVVPDAELPHPDTRFRLLADHPAVPPALAASWVSVAPLLRAGTSAAEAAQLLGLTVHECQTTLYRYRSADMITLSPADTAEGTPAAQERFTSPETHSVLRRFIHRLRGWGTA